MNKIANSNYKGFFSLVLVLYLLHTAPALGYYTPPAVYAATLVLLYLSTYMVCGAKRFNRYFLLSIPIMGLSWLAIFYSSFQSFGVPIKELYGLAQQLIYFIVGIYIMDSKDYQMAKRVLITILLVFIATSVTTYIGDTIYPTASRDLTGLANQENSITTSLYLSMNIGGFSFIYNIVLMIPIVIGQYKNRLMVPVLAMSLLVLFYLVVEKSQFTTAFLLSVLLSPLFFIQKSFNARAAFKYMAILFFVFLMVRAILPLLLDIFSSNVSGDAVQTRLVELSDFLSGEGSGTNSDLEARQDLYSASYEAFLSSPLWGTLDKTKVGGHSYLLDAMGVYGLLGLLLYFICWRKLYRVYFKPIATRKWFGYFLMVFLLAIIMTIVNPQMNMMFLLLIIPCYILQYEKNLSNPV